MNQYQWIGLTGLLMAAALHSHSLRAAPDEKIFGAVYRSAGQVVPSQSQVIFYNPVDMKGSEAAHVYVDDEFEAALLPGMYTRFCVTPGSHTLGVWRNDAPLYKGKRETHYRATLKGGKAYFVRVDAEVNGRPLPVRRKEAEQALSRTRNQLHTLSRASGVKRCDFIEQPFIEYALSSDVLFTFAKAGPADIQRSGRDAISRLVAQLTRDGVHLNPIRVIGHTDPLGDEQRNLALGERRARTVANMLTEGGLPRDNITIESVGSRQPQVTCSGSRQAQISCNAPNRRVVVRVETTR